ncbi:lipopolysaccharide biosynthesis protein [Tsukamurella pseudospumae]|uniref:Polysaccharide biosynthesis protein n=1 Tax=Tsukamurella pseudospumae TaxID=239498 RepID=A0A137ZMU6_9ACTN|nr:polysaccharide biosynthesis protein [Tsukamurella pseudospumae]KXO99486.1 polysaccharide biosynthesis protein [Tsukamurella pseudospumae]
MSGLAWVTVGSMLANLCSYLVHLPASRWLGPSGYGEFAALLQLVLVLAVPALALQTVVARQVVRGAGAAQMRRLGYVIAVGATLLAGVAVPLAAAGLHTRAITAAAALAAAPALVLLAVEQGVLQGERRFGRLAVLLAVAGLGKLAFSIPGLLVGPGPALLGTTVGALVAAGLGRVLAGSPPGSDGAPSLDPVAGVRAVLGASSVQLVLAVFASLDLLLARPVLGAAAGGTYALGAVAAKVAFWLPQAVGVVFYPQLATPERARGALRTVLALLIGLGLVCVAGAAICAPLATLLAGAEYRPVQGLLWLFAAQGALIALLQGLLLYAIAIERTRMAGYAWAVLAVEAAVLLTWPRTPAEMITAAALGALAAVMVVGAVVAISAGRPVSGSRSPRSGTRPAAAER